MVKKVWNISVVLGIIAVLTNGFVKKIENPSTEISNGIVSARLYLPHSETGYYQGTRFDWSGVISHLDYKGHSYFGQWFEKYDPKLNDAIMGPVQEFSPLGYNEAKAGETFV